MAATKSATRKPSLRIVGKPEQKPAAKRPVLLESDVFRKEVSKRLKEVAGEIDILDAAELQAERDCEEAIRHLTEKRAAERAAQGHRRADLTRISNGCKAALDASEEQQAA